MLLRYVRNKVLIKVSEYYSQCVAPDAAATAAAAATVEARTV